MALVDYYDCHKCQRDQCKDDDYIAVCVVVRKNIEDVFQ